MSTTIPQHHQLILDNLSKSQQVGGRKAVHDLYRVCLDAFNGGGVPPADIGVWGIETNDIKLVTATNLKTGMYIQLSRSRGGLHVLMTVGKKIAIETSDPVTSSRNTRVFA